MSRLSRCLQGVGLFGSLCLSACSANSNGAKPKHDVSGGAGGGVGVDPSSVCGTSQVGAPRLRRLSRSEILATLGDVFPEARSAWTASLSADPISTQGFDNDSSLLVVGKQTAAELDVAGTALGKAVSGAALAAMLPCSASTPDAACAQQFLDKYGKKLFRRALRPEENARYLALVQQVAAAQGFATGIGFVTRALVQSPHVVYRREIGTASGNDYTLAPAEVATELAYDFTGTTPSDELLAQAEAGALATPGAREAVARELLMSPSGLATVEKFFDSWLGYGQASSMTKPGVPEFATLREQLVGETRRFLGELVVVQNGGLNELLTLGFTTPSAAGAAFYGLPAPTADYAVTQRAAGHGVGILAQASLLAALSGPSASSPTKRGVLVMERLLCRQKPVVPPMVPMLSPPEPGNFTTRQHYENIHAKEGSCKACHSRFDPIGFGFEHFDEVGRYRELEGGLEVDSNSFVPSEDGSGHLFDFSNQEELAQGLAQQRAPYECTTGYLSTYVYGAAEACLGETKRGDFVERKLGFIDYLASLAAEPHFSRRKLQ